MYLLMETYQQRERSAAVPGWVAASLDRLAGLCSAVFRPVRRSYCVFNQSEETFLGLNIIRADTQLARLRGLLGRLRVGSGEGIWLVPSRGVHTIGVPFPIDVVYLDDENRVIDIVEHLRPFSISPIRMKSASVLELPTHTIYASQTRVGDQFVICEPQDIESYLKARSPQAETVGGLRNAAAGASGV